MSEQHLVNRVNWALYLGMLLVLGLLLVSIAGPTLAPKDPQQQFTIIQVNGKWLKPPYPAFTPGFLLGSDAVGRDLFSWLLWAIRPTLVMVLLVASLRLMLSLLLGLGAGWGGATLSAMCDGLLAAALATPTLLVALVVITAVGFKLGVWAFVLGLIATGWAETAQLVREETRRIKSSQAVEAAHALGASGGQILFLHILPHIMPMVWMLLAFEVSGTMVTLAGLGFLGYYVGGATFVEVGDFIYRRVAEMPELGQMLSTTRIVLTDPWAMAAAGTVVFLIVLGFNLLGEGLQRRLQVQRGGSRAFYLFMAGEVVPWGSGGMLALLRRLAYKPWGRAALAGLMLSLVAGGVWWQHGRPPADDTAPATALPAVPGGHLWATERRDPWGTLWTSAAGPATPDIVWTFTGAGAFSGGPLLAADGTIYIASAARMLYALDATGVQRWAATLPVTPTQTPALAPNGVVYVIDVSGGLAAVAPDGSLLWHTLPKEPGLGFASPTVDADGTAYYVATRSGSMVMRAVAADGTLRWASAPMPFQTATSMPALSPAGDWLFWQDFVLAVNDGALVPEFTETRAELYFVGADGQTYLALANNKIAAIKHSAGGVTFAEPYGWFFREKGIQRAKAIGVTPTGIVWLFGNVNQIQGSVIAWGALGGDPLGVLDLPGLYGSRVVAVDHNGVIYLCGITSGQYAKPEAYTCYALQPGATAPLWEFTLNNEERILGAALGEGRLYITTNVGLLYALGSE